MTVRTSDQVSAATVRELLVPVDLSHESWAALPLARSIAGCLSVPIVALFVDVSTGDSHAVLEHLLLLRTIVAGEAVCVEVLPGRDVVEAIRCRAEDRPGGVVVMSTRGMSGLAERAGGDLCNALLESRSASVLAVGPRFDPDLNAAIQRVAVCIDSAAPDYPMLRDALGWAELLNVAMVVVIVQGAGRSRPGEDETYGVLATIFEDLPPTRVAVTAETVDDLDVASAIVRFGDRRAGTLLAVAPGAAERAVHVLTHAVTMRVAGESRGPMLLRWHRP